MACKILIIQGRIDQTDAVQGGAWLHHNQTDKDSGAKETCSGSLKYIGGITKLLQLLGFLHNKSDVWGP